MDMMGLVVTRQHVSLQAERGKVKHKYHQRKVVGDYVYVLVHAGFIAQAANNHIYSTV